MGDEPKGIVDAHGRPIPKKEPVYKKWTAKTKATVLAGTATLALIAGVLANLQQIIGIFSTDSTTLTRTELPPEDVEQARLVGNQWIDAVLERNIDELIRLSDVELFLFETVPINSEDDFRAHFEQIPAERIEAISGRRSLRIGRLSDLKERTPKQ